MKKENIARSFLFKGIESFGNQGISFIFNIILARLIDPSEYGILTLITIFISISRVIVNSGLNTALVQKNKIDDDDYSSAFFLSSIISIIIYIILFSLSPKISEYYDNYKIKSALRFLSIILLLSPINLIQTSIVARERKFMDLMTSSLIATFISGIVGITLAYLKYSYWALCVQQILQQAILSIILAKKLKYKIKLSFKLNKTLSLLTFSWKLLISGIFDVIYENLRGLIIGKQYSEANLAYYNRGRQFPELIMSSVNNTVQSVSLPSLSERQNKKDEFLQLFRQTLKLSTYIVFPLMFGLAATAKPIIFILLGEKWLFCVPFLQFACIDFALFPIHTLNLQAINAKGRSDVFLIQEIIKKIYGLIILFISVYYFKDVIYIVIGASISSIISYFVNAYPNKHISGYNIASQIKDMSQNILISFVMYICVYALSYLHINIYLLFIFQIGLGIFIFFALSHLLKNESFKFLINKMRNVIK